MARLTRREWLGRSLLAAAGAGVAAAWPRPAGGQVVGANEAVRVAVAGLRTRGLQLVDWFRKVPGVRVVALCDCDTQFFAPALKRLGDAPEKVATVNDFRRLLDDKDIDAVVLATPNHWHALQTVWACRAGKDVYVEKPVSHTLVEGRKMVEAARKYGRIVQAGTQNRSCTGLRAALAWLREGHLGPMKLVRGYDYPARQSIGKTAGPQPVPDTCDYNLFQGPAPVVPLRRKDLHYDWHWFWATGDGDAGNRGVHTFDHIRWFIDQPDVPPRTVSVAGRFGWGDDGETPNTQVTLFDYRPVPVLWEMQTLPKRTRPEHLAKIRGLAGSMVIECEGGFFSGNRGGGTAFDRQGKVVKPFRGDSGVTHAANFIAAMRNRRTGDLAADVREGHVSSALCHLANISHLTGRPASPAEIGKAAAGSDLLSESFERLLEHLKANEVDVGRTPLTLGLALALDVKTERFVGEGAEQANARLDRTYRSPFVMPEEV